MSDNKLRCALVYRLQAGSTTMLSKYDHAGQYESHGGSNPEGALYGDRDNSYAEAVAKVVENDPPGGLAESGTIGGFKVVQSDQHQVVYGADSDGICFGVITGHDYPSRIAIQMLQDLYKDFMEKHAGQVASASNNELTKKSKKVMQTVCEKYADLDKVDKAAAVLGKVDVVKSQMQDNISDMLKNTEQAETLAEKSDQLNEQASVFKKKSNDLRKQMACKNLKMTLILGGLIVVILLVILVPLIKKAKNN